MDVGEDPVAYLADWEVFPGILGCDGVAEHSWLDGFTCC